MTEPASSLGVLATVRGAYGLTWRRRGAWLRLAWAPLLLSWLLIALGFRDGGAWLREPLYVAAQLLLLPMFAVSFAAPWHRAVAAADDDAARIPARALPWRGADWRYYGVVMLYLAAAGIVFALSWALFYGDPGRLLGAIVARLPEPLAAALPTGLLYYGLAAAITGLLFAPPLWLMLRTCLALPALALGRPGSLAGAWRAGKGLTARLALVVVMTWLPLRAVSGALKQLLPAAAYEGMAVLVPQLLGEAANFLALGLLLAALTLAYRQGAGAPRPP